VYGAAIGVQAWNAQTLAITTIIHSIQRAACQCATMIMCVTPRSGVALRRPCMCHVSVKGGRSKRGDENGNAARAACEGRRRGQGHALVQTADLPLLAPLPTGSLAE
jgi:hypothetical protein